MNLKLRWRGFFQQIWRYEFWPFYLFYLPMMFYWVWLALRARHATYFTVANPSMPYSGIFGESKKEILSGLPQDYLPPTIYLHGNEAGHFMEMMADARMNFPVVIKPEIGERGNQVEKINTPHELETFLNAQPGDEWIIQQFVDYPVEAGIFYYRLPDGSSSGIFSLTLKHFLSVTGDGKQSLADLVASHDRARKRFDYLKQKFKDQWDRVLPAAEALVLEPIGNHCRGTAFLDGHKYISNQLINFFDQIAEQINGFYIGRFDVKATSLEALTKGENILILELNGITSEPGHIYDPDYSLIRAYRGVKEQMDHVYQVSMQNIDRGMQPAPTGEVAQLIFHHFFKGKRKEVDYVLSPKNAVS